MKKLTFLVLLALLTSYSYAQTVLINTHFNTTTALTDLGSLVTTGGTVTLSPTKAADGVCSQGMVQVNSAGGFLQINVSSCTIMSLNMKSTASARTVKVSYQKQGESVFTVLTSTLSVSTAATFDFHALFPTIVTTTPIMVKIEPVSGNIQIHDLSVVSNNALSTAADITAFSISNQIGNTTINSGAATIGVNVPLGTNLTSVTPSVLNISPSATVNPTVGTARDFSNPVTYTVTAQDRITMKSWTVTVTLVDPNTSFTDYEAENAVFTGSVATNHLNFTGTGFIDFATSGPNTIIFNICQQTAGTQTVKFRYSFAKTDIRTAQLLVNDVYIQDILFPQTATFDDWTDAIATVSLNQGNNTIKLYWAATDGPNLDKMSITGAQCPTYTLTVAGTNGGTVTVDPSRANNTYFRGETVTLTAVNASNATFNNWSGDLTGSTNPSVITMNSIKNITANFTSVSTYTLTLNKTGIGNVTASPAASNGVYAAGTVVTLTATPLLGNSFINWTGGASGSSSTTTVTMNANTTVTGNFTSNYTFDFNKVVGYASINGDGFTGPTTGGQTTTQPVLCINGPSEFNKLCEALYYRQRVYAGKTPTNGMLKAPLIILLKAGTYDASQTLSSIGTNVYGNSMMDIPEQGDLTIIGENGVTFNFGINVKRAWNIIIRNISFYNYQDDGVNIGYPETHHIWVDHCTFGPPTTISASKDVPDGTSDIKDGASFITMSWNMYRHHWKTCLLGHSDNNGATDLGRLKVTYFANYFYATNSRHPRTRFTTCHVMNNMYEDVGLGLEGDLGYGIGASNQSQVWAEGNFFLNTRWPMLADRSNADFAAVYGPNLLSPNSNIQCFGLKSVNNEYDDSGLQANSSLTLVGKVAPGMLNPSGFSIKFDELSTPQFVYNPASEYNYSADLLPAQAVRILVPLYAGADKMNWGVSCATIPLSLLDFAATRQNNEAVLTWKTVNEQEVSHFEVERSEDGKGFYSIGQTKANNNLDINTYSLTDKTPLVQIQYYRLKMVDLDGSIKYSKVVSLSKNGGFSVKIYPSVTKDILRVETTTSGACSINIVDVLGRIVYSQQLASTDDTTKTEVNVSNLSNGVYSVIFENANGHSSAKFVKQ